MSKYVTIADGSLYEGVYEVEDEHFSTGSERATITLRKVIDKEELLVTHICEAAADLVRAFRSRPSRTPVARARLVADIENWVNG